MNLKSIRTAVLPVAGLGTRFLPMTKAMPKEMLPIIDRPVIQYVVEEAIAAGITNFIFVTSSSKGAIEDYFDVNFELEVHLKERGKKNALQVLDSILPENVTISYIRQPRPMGLGHAILCTEAFVGNEPFVVLLPDDIVDSAGKGCLQSMVERYMHTGSSVIALEAVAYEDTDKYGIATLHMDPKLGLEIKNVVEKPNPAEAPSRFAIMGRYVLTSAIFKCLHETKPGKGGEIQLTDAIAQLIQSERVLGYEFSGLRYDCGHPEGWLQAILAYALKRPSLKAVLDQFYLAHQDELMVKQPEIELA